MQISLARQKYTVRLLYKKVITTVLKQTIFFRAARPSIFLKFAARRLNDSVFRVAAVFDCG
jgi:hypothetical protein